MNDQVQHIRTTLKLARIRNNLFDFSGAAALLDTIEDPPAWLQKDCSELLAAIDHNRRAYLYETMNPDALAPGDSIAFNGFFSVRLHGPDKPKAGELHIRGSVFSHRRETIFLFVNEMLAAAFHTDPPHDSRFPSQSFHFELSSTFAPLLPDNARISLACRAKLLQSVSGHAMHYHSSKNTKNLIAEKLQQGAIVSSHGLLTSLNSNEHRGWLDTYRQTREFLHKQHRMSLFLCYGTLLGFVRSGEPIAHDDDFDAAYFSAKTCPADVKQEMTTIITSLVVQSPNVQIQLVNFFFKVDFGEGFIDIFPGWHDGTRLWMPWTTCLQTDASLLAETEAREFVGTPVLIPRRAEEFLALKYGPEWRKPDPAYRMKRLAGISYPFPEHRFTRHDLESIIAEASRHGASSPQTRVTLRA